MIDAASFNPIQSPITANAIQIVENDWAKPSTIHAIAIGMISINMDFWRPNLSEIIMPNRLPIGCAMNVQLAAMTFKLFYGKIFTCDKEKKSKARILHSHDDWSAVMWICSSGFISLLMPINDGITIAWNVVNSPKFKNIISVAITARTLIKIFKTMKCERAFGKKNNLESLLAVICDEMNQLDALLFMHM